MSFVGPADPEMHRMLAAAYAKDMVLIAAAGNAGPNSAPLYPAADPDVIAVTATDSNDRLYNMANHGAYIAVAAPGVEILALAPGAGIPNHDGNVSRHRACQRNRRVIAGTSTIAQARRCSRHHHDHGEAARIRRPTFRFGCRSGERLSRRDGAHRKIGGKKRRRAHEAVIEQNEKYAHLSLRPSWQFDHAVAG